MENDYENESCGWPGDGSGEDDLADFNANEADDYANEGGFDNEESLNNEADSFGNEDAGLDAYYENQYDLGD